MVDVSIDTRDYEINPALVRAGLMQKVDGEMCFTAAGMFAMAGLDRQTEVSIRQLFSKRINPADGGKKGLLLAAQCREVAKILGAEKLFALLKVQALS